MLLIAFQLFAKASNKQVSYKAKESPVIKKLLHKAEISYQSGNWDESFYNYEKILLIDSNNIVARLGMEMIDEKKEAKASFSAHEKKIQMLDQVDQEWELPIMKNNSSVASIIEQPPIPINGKEATLNKLSQLVIPIIEFYDLPISEAINQIKKKATLLDSFENNPHKKGVNIVLQLHSLNTPEEPKITLSLRDLPLKEVLSYISKQANLALQIEPYAVLLVPQQDIQEHLITKEYKVSTTFINSLSSWSSTKQSPEKFSSSDKEGIFNPKEFFLSQGVTFPKGAMAYYIPSNNILIIKNTQSNLDLVSSIIESFFENTTSQIEIEARFLEVKQNNHNEEGFNWLLGSLQFPLNSGTSTSPATSNLPYDPSNTLTTPIKDSSTLSKNTLLNKTALSAVALGTPYAPATGVLALAGILTNTQFQVVLKALSQQQGINLLSAPKVTVSSGHRATINIAREFPYPADYIPPQIPQNQGGGVNPAIPATPSSFKKRDIGVELEVEPRIIPEDSTIELTLAPQIVEFQGFVNYGTPIYSQAPVFFAGQTNSILSTQQVLLTQNTINQPIFSIRQVTTEVTLHDGQTVVLGGLMREDIQKINNKVPILGNIPLLGALFHSSSQKKMKQNLLIFVTVHVIDAYNRKNK